jgi:hypothetical protein
MHCGTNSKYFGEPTASIFGVTEIFYLVDKTIFSEIVIINHTTTCHVPEDVHYQNR